MAQMQKQTLLAVEIPLLIAVLMVHHLYFLDGTTIIITIAKFQQMQHHPIPQPLILRRDPSLQVLQPPKNAPTGKALPLNDRVENVKQLCRFQPSPATMRSHSLRRRILSYCE